MTVVATVCARAGSRGVPGKNVRPLLGRPLVAYTLEQALACPAISAVYVSTDSEEVADVARGMGAVVPGMRPAELATDTAPKVPVIQHLVETIETMGVDVSTVVDLDATSPLRLSSDITAALDLLDDDTDVVITGYRSDKNPYFNMVEPRPGGAVGLVKPPSAPIVSRQTSPPVFAMNASVYCWHRRSLSRGLWSGVVKMHEMPPERSIDIDSDLDWRLVELLMADRLAEPGEVAQ